MSEYTDRLYSLVVESIDDILAEHANGYKSRFTELEEIEGGIDDGSVYGNFRLYVDHGLYVIDIEAAANFQGEQDCYDWSRESHYTKSVGYDELEDFWYEVTKVIKTEKDIDHMIDQDIETSKEVN
jgi:hypothetical protein